MLRSLYYNVEFPSTGRLFENRIEFAPGLTAITGRNESGKSLIVEMILYALFGKSALRGMASDYKNLKVELCLTVLGKNIIIKRYPKHELLTVDGIETAVGADAINKTVPQLLGFGLDVFKVSLAALQDELNEFTNMRPTARAKMVDDLTGMNRLELLEVDCKSTAKQHKQMAEALTLNMIKPVEPEKPVGYMTSDQVEKSLAAEHLAQVQRKVALSIREPVKPIEPVKPPFIETLEELEKYQEQVQARAQLRASLKNQIDKIPDPISTLTELADYEAYVEYQQEVSRRGPKTSYELSELRDWQEYYTGTKAKCPECSFEFIIGSKVNPKDTPPISSSEVDLHLSYLNNWKQPIQEVCYEGPTFDLVKEKIAHARSEEKAALRQQLENSPLLPDRAEDLKLARDYDKLLGQYIVLTENYSDQLAEYNSAQITLSKTPDNSAKISQLEELAKICVLYEHQIQDFNQKTDHYNTVALKLETEQRLSQEYLSGAKSIKNTRLRVKRELAPLISQTASSLLYQLTEGERQAIVVDEDFNVWVDNQPLQTLSGSGKAVVNLALRVGMGQVLTAKVLSLFIGDEIDGSMDKTRAEATHNTFKRLAEHLDQVILITHKPIAADNIISL